MKKPVIDKKLFNSLPRYYLTVLASCLIILLACEFLVYINPAFGKIAVLAWYLIWLLLFVFVLKLLLEILKFSFRHNSYLTLLSLLILMLVIILTCNDPRTLSGETSQEIKCILDKFSTSASWGFSNTCFIGYPARQFYLPALPSLLFGRSLFALNFGGSWYFILGILVFAAGVIKWLAVKPRLADFCAALALIIPLHFYYFNYLLLNYEQSFYPLSLTFLLCGFYLLYLNKPSKKILLLAGFVLLVLVSSYTTSLAVLALALFVLAVLFFQTFKTRDKKLRMLILGIAIGVVLSLIFSLQYRADIRLVTGTHSPELLKQDLFSTLQLILTQSNGHELFSPLFHPMFLVLFLTLLTFFWGKKAFLAALWCIAVVVFACISQGYTYQSFDYRIHRAMIIIPVFLTALIEPVKQFKFSKDNIYWLGIVFYLIILGTGLFYNMQELKIRNESKYYDFYLLVDWMEYKVSQDQNTIYFSNSLDDRFLSLYDFSQYFIPQSELVYRKQICGLTFDTSNRIYYLVIDQASVKSKCFSEQAANFKYVAKTKIRDGTVFNLYRYNTALE